MTRASRCKSTPWVGCVRSPNLSRENLLRVAGKRLTNIIKHSRAARATITPDYGPHNVILTIADTGVGFVINEQAGPREGHFGLLGISEHTTRLRGKVSITSEPGGHARSVMIPD